MGAVWSALPEVSPPSEDGRWLAALPVTPAAYATNTSDALLGYVCIRGQPDPPDPASVNSLLARYPDAEGARAATFNQQLQGNVTSWGLGVAVSWPTDQPASGSLDPPLPLTSYVAFRLPLHRWTTERWLVPEVGDGSDRLRPALLWWILLHGLASDAVRASGLAGGAGSGQLADRRSADRATRSGAGNRARPATRHGYIGPGGRTKNSRAMDRDDGPLEDRLTEDSSLPQRDRVYVCAVASTAKHPADLLTCRRWDETRAQRLRV